MVRTELADGQDRTRGSSGAWGETTTASMPGPTWAPITAPTSFTTSRPTVARAVAGFRRAAPPAPGSPGARPRCRRPRLRRPARRSPRAGPAPGSTSAPSRAGRSARRRSGAGLDRERRPDQGSRRADPTAPAKVLQRVDVEQPGRRAGLRICQLRSLGGRRASVQRCGGRCDGEAGAIPSCRESTTRTSMSTARAASWADSTVPDTSLDRWIETMASAPAAAAFR